MSARHSASGRRFEGALQNAFLSARVILREHKLKDTNNKIANVLGTMIVILPLYLSSQVSLKHADQEMTYWRLGATFHTPNHLLVVLCWFMHYYRN